MRLTFTGVGTALITPFTRTGALDEAAVRRLAQRQVDAGVHFLVPCGTTGETPTLSAAERTTRRRNRRRGGRGARARARRRRRLRHARSHSRRGRDAARRRAGHPVGHAVLQQADAGRALPALQGDRREHVAARSSSTTCRAGPAATSIRRRSRGSRGIPNIVGVKEASGNMTQMAEICRSRAVRRSSCCRETTR